MRGLLTCRRTLLLESLRESLPDERIVGDHLGESLCDRLVRCASTAFRLSGRRDGLLDRLEAI
jgi:hypothetical protein